MVAGLKFLSKKGFNPQNLSNQKKVWERKQAEKQEAKKMQERQAQLQRERDDEELARSRGDTPKLAFLYAVPPGMETDRDRKDQDQNTEQESSEKPTVYCQGKEEDAKILLPTQRQPGDDDAAAAFRLMLAAGTTASSMDDEHTLSNASNRHPFVGSFGTVLQGAKTDQDGAKKFDGPAGAISALEKAVGRSAARSGGGNHQATLREQVERFPVLAHAPRAKGMTATDVGVQFKPLGAQIRHVRCLVCGVWGHSRGDRECKESGWNPFAAQPFLSTATATTTTTTSSATRSGNEQKSAATVPFTSSEEHQKKVKEKRQGKRRDSFYLRSDSSSSRSDSDTHGGRRKEGSKRKQKRWQSLSPSRSTSSLDDDHAYEYIRRRRGHDDPDRAESKEDYDRPRRRKRSPSPNAQGRDHKKHSKSKIRRESKRR